MRLLLAALLLSCPVWADDDSEDDGPPPMTKSAKNMPNVLKLQPLGKPKKGGKGSKDAPAGKEALGALPEELAGTKWLVYPNLKAMPEHVGGSHGVARMEMPKIGHAVGIKGGSGGVCSFGATPAVPHDSGCYWWLMITPQDSEKPLKGCLEGPLMGGGMRSVSITWSTNPAVLGACQVKPEGKYYCRITATGYGKQGDGKPARCGGAYASNNGMHD